MNGTAISLSEAITLALGREGVGLLGDPQRMLGHVMDLASPDDVMVGAFGYNCDATLLRPFADAAATGTPEALAGAARRAEAILRDERQMQAEMAHSLAFAVAQGVAAYRGVPLQEAVPAPQGGTPAQQAAPAGYAYPQGAPDDPMPARYANQGYPGGAPSPADAIAGAAWENGAGGVAAQAPRQRKPWVIPLVIVLVLAAVGGGVALALRSHVIALPGAATVEHDPRFVGLWAQTMEADAYTGELMVNDHLPLGYGYLVLEEDGTVRRSWLEDLGDESSGYTWSSNGDEVTLHSDELEAYANAYEGPEEIEYDVTYTLEDGMLVYSYDLDGGTYRRGYTKIDPSEYVSWEDAKIDYWGQACNGEPMDVVVADTDQYLLRIAAKGYTSYSGDVCYEVVFTNRSSESLGVECVSEAEMNGHLEYFDDGTSGWVFSYEEGTGLFADGHELEYGPSLYTGAIEPGHTGYMTLTFSMEEDGITSIDQLVDVHLIFGIFSEIDTGDDTFSRDYIAFHTFDE